MMAKKWKSINIVMFLAASLSIIGCSSRKYTIYQYDNGDDYICEGLRRIVDKSGKIGFADEKGNVAISPRYAFAFPFEKGMAKVTFEGYSVAEGEYSRWISREWFYVDHKGDRIDSQDYSEIETELRRYVADIDAGIGIAVIIDGKDTVSVNGDRCFPMMSVFKFPQALAVADYCMKNGIGLSDTITVRAEEIRENTWSPMREKYGVRDLGLSVAELIGFILRQSDNNASDVLFRMIGGPPAADSLMRSMGHDGIVIAHTEDEMHRNADLCYINHSTPIEMARLFDCFYRQNMIHDNPFFELIGESMMSCTTGGDRLPAPLTAYDVTIGHKTGTGDKNTHGRIMAVNDAGYVFLPDGRGYAIAVFVADSPYEMAATSGIIADISGIVFEKLRCKTE